MAKSKKTFADYVQQIERKANVHAWVIIDPAKPDHPRRVLIAYPKNGAGSVVAVAWLPGTNPADLRPWRHAGTAAGGGYDKASAAMAGARFTDRKGAEQRILDDGYSWDHQLRDAGFIVVQAI